MKLLVFLLVPLYLFGGATFITDEEYASSLFKNPRGIGCNNCHGDDGKGRVVAHYISKGEQKIYGGSDITKLGFKDFFEALDGNTQGMPKYFLTKDEIEALYKYLHKVKKQ